MQAEQKESVYVATIRLLERVQSERRPWTCDELRRVLRESVGSGDLAAYTHICDTYFYPPHDVFYAGDAAYTLAVMRREMGVGHPTPPAFKVAAGNLRSEK